MRAGRLLKRVRVERAVESKNSLGETVQTWDELKSIWAEIEPIRGDERYGLMQAKSTTDTKITTRGSAAAGITAKDRFIYKDHVFDIDAIVDWQMRGVFSEFFCKEAA